MSIDLPVTLRLLSHELRTPVGVIQGYLKMLGDGRIEEHMRPKIIAQIQRAAARVAVIGQQASDLSRWMADPASRPGQHVRIRQLLDDICARSPGAVRLMPMTSAEIEDGTILTTDLGALIDAGTAMVEAIARTYGNDAVLSVALAEDIAGVDLRVKSAASGQDTDTSARSERRPIEFAEKGLGLSLLIAAAVVSAHGGRLWEQPGQPTLGMTLPWSHEL